MGWLVPIQFQAIYGSLDLDILSHGLSAWRFTLSKSKLLDWVQLDPANIFVRLQLLIVYISTIQSGFRDTNRFSKKDNPLRHCCLVVELRETTINTGFRGMMPLQLRLGLANGHFGAELHGQTFQLSGSPSCELAGF
ncbi:hypothetical protein Dform_01132 [Dehalogenimonas formicexedens]|uniref:Uncharacterized protein n=1 Tax=Dehalogenimonas formicexedens TaxID=1839801 RepID=A0A1P8F7J9_9CHLR|nr:hypothetical protein [Dehalogenimonas formicexedens]APV44466.1 hypothetical protein Dform_01132 [Dehalogenimonas formicexedens]